MNTVYVVVFDWPETGKYVHKAFSTREVAQDYADACNVGHIPGEHFLIVEEIAVESGALVSA